MKLIEYIVNHKDWKNELQKPPYSLSIKEKGSLIMFNYTVDSIPSEIVNEARGLILEIGNKINVIRYGFYRFYNYVEEGAAALNMKKVFATEKIDGSVIMLYYYKGNWYISTRNTFDAFDAPLGNSERTFGDLAIEAMKSQGIIPSQLLPQNTYVFELVSPEYQHVVNYEDTKLYFLMARNNNTYKEVDVKTDWLRPRRIEVSSYEQIINYVSTFDGKEFEGVVLQDNYNNRVKVKNLKWLKLHKLHNNGNLTVEAALNLVDMGEMDEYLAYFPEKKDFVNRILFWKQTSMSYALSLDMIDLKENYPDRKDYAEKVLNSYAPHEQFLMFKAYDNRAYEYMTSLSNKKLAELYAIEH
jgi:hypothetical protein